jgi:hypothetical protein
MKVILEAFQGKLRSEPMDWPEEAGDRIHLLLDIDPIQDIAMFKDVPPPVEAIQLRQGVFQYTGYAEPIRRVGDVTEFARVYRLVGI